MLVKKRAERNRTITLTKEEYARYSSRLLRLETPVEIKDIVNKTINQDMFEVLHLLPEQFVDLLFVDPPYNLAKSFNAHSFSKMPLHDYAVWVDSWLSQLTRVLKPTASIYICGDWQSSAAVHQVLEEYFIVRNRITWEREKGRGAQNNWKNASEDIWFCTVSEDYVFDVDSVKLKRRVIAPYTQGDGQPKDWEKTDIGNFRLTHPSNLWSDLTVPFWSMPENTDHPTQKPEKLLAKIILASSNPGGLVLDPFLGSGTTSVVAKKLGRNYVGIEIDKTYCCFAEKRLEMAEGDNRIQGYSERVFWERNTLANQPSQRGISRKAMALQSRLFLFDNCVSGQTKENDEESDILY
ncbi:MAG: DNA-methyltransferase [Dehalococcoidia bacterium]|nr:DNA adenine methyltransferase YhdJ [Chloroflexota bacterium]MBT9160466.1 DNA adenine methyltransferase YhdJ [Chloroflexota bacterium]MBT9162943.1 DNA adenine methyltransferase YhdJ [Chloroflexota bacterium]